MYVSAGLGEGYRVVLTGFRDLERLTSKACIVSQLSVSALGVGMGGQEDLSQGTACICCAHFPNLPQMREPCLTSSVFHARLDCQGGSFVFEAGDLGLW